MWRTVQRRVRVRLHRVLYRRVGMWWRTICSMASQLLPQQVHELFQLVPTTGIKAAKPQLILRALESVQHAIRLCRPRRYCSARWRRSTDGSMRRGVAAIRTIPGITVLTWTGMWNWTGAGTLAPVRVRMAGGRCVCRVVSRRRSAMPRSWATRSVATRCVSTRNVSASCLGWSCVCKASRTLTWLLAVGWYNATRHCCRELSWKKRTGNKKGDGEKKEKEKTREEEKEEGEDKRWCG